MEVKLINQKFESLGLKKSYRVLKNDKIDIGGWNRPRKSYLIENDNGNKVWYLAKNFEEILPKIEEKKVKADIKLKNLSTDENQFLHQILSHVNKAISPYVMYNNDSLESMKRHAEVKRKAELDKLLLLVKERLGYTDEE